MNDAMCYINTLNRPRLLIHAVQHALAGYNRDKSLKRITKNTNTPRPGNALQSLVNSEDALERARVSGDATYSAARHIEVFTAMIAENRLAATTNRQ